MPDQDFATTERKALAAALRAAGPDAPTLCEGWTAADLAAHVWQRENRPWQAVGLMVKPLAPVTERGLSKAKQRGFATLVDDIEHGPVSVANPMRLPKVNQLVNFAEMFIHTEDVRRGGGDTTPRPLPAAESDAVWQQAKAMAKGKFLRCPVGLRLERTGDRPVTITRAHQSVTVVGPPAELLLFVSGRRDAARVELQGTPEAIATLKAFHASL